MITSQYSGKPQLRILSNLLGGGLKVASAARRSKTLISAVILGFVYFCEERSFRESPLAMMLVGWPEETGYLLGLNSFLEEFLCARPQRTLASAFSTSSISRPIPVKVCIASAKAVRPRINAGAPPPSPDKARSRPELNWLIV